MIPFLTLLTLLVTPPTDSGVSALAEDLTQAVLRRVVLPPGRILRVRDNLAVVDLPDLPPGTRVEWLVDDGVLRDPETFESVGTLQRPCGELTVVRSDSSFSEATIHAFDACAVPVVGSSVRSPLRTSTLRLRGGNAPQQLQGLLDLLVAVLPERFRRTGAFEPLSAADPTPTDVEITLHLAEQLTRLHVLVELRATSPRPLVDAVYFDRPAVPEMLWRDRRSDAATPFGLASIAVDGQVLALAHNGKTGAASALVVLTDSALASATLDPNGALVLTPLIDLNDLPPKKPRTRQIAGFVTARADHLCFATTTLASGWCLRESGVERLDGVPLAHASRLLLGRFVPGTTTLDGTLRDESGTLLADVSPFVRCRSAANGGLRLLRNDGYLDLVDREFHPVSGRSGPVGDAWAELGVDRSAYSAPSMRGAVDSVTLVSAGQERRVPVAGDLVAMEALDVDGDTNLELALATTADRKTSRLTLQRP